MNETEHVETVVKDCHNDVSIDLFMHLSLVPAVLITAVLSFLQRRAQTLPIDHKLPFLGGRFAIVVPLDTIGSLSNRWSYGFAFGAVSYSVLRLFSENYIPFNVPNWARAVVYLVGAIEVGLVNFPFFACLSTPFRMTGAVLGILYSIAWIIITLWYTFTCPGGKVDFGKIPEDDYPVALHPLPYLPPGTVCLHAGQRCSNTSSAGPGGSRGAD